MDSAPQSHFALRSPPEGYAGSAASRFAAQLSGALVAGFVVLGRWDIGRLFPEFQDEWILQPRVWIVAVQFTVLIFLPRRAGKGPGLIPGTVDRLVFAILLCLGASVLWAPDAEIGMQKVREITLVLISTWCLRSALIRYSSLHIFHSFLLTLALLTGGLALVALSSIAGGERLAVLGGGPNAFSRLMGYLLLCSIYYWRTSSKLGWFWLALIGLAGSLVILTGSRGGLLSSLVAIAVWAVSSRGRWRVKILGAVLVAFSAVTIAILFDFDVALYDMFLSRVVNLTFVEGYISGRDRLVETSILLALENPFLGIGLGGFYAETSYYPHNLFLELAVEAGAVPLLLGLGAVVAYLVAIRQSQEGSPFPFLPALALSMTWAQFSGDMFDNRTVFIFVILSLASRVKVGRTRR